MKYSKIVVVAPEGAKSGGPEALHHLVHAMVAAGFDAYICYYPFDREYGVPEPYQQFDTPVTRFQDDASTVFIFPEIFPTLALKIQHGKAVIWWLSLDNYFARRPQVSGLRNFARYVKLKYTGKRPLGGVGSLRRLLHWSQSHYVNEFLQKHDIQCFNLFEPINPRYNNMAQIEKRAYPADNVVLFNPLKGMHLTQKIIDFNPQIQFTPLSGLTQQQLTNHFQHAKLYIDFGHHPGRDRMPREAALLGCCIVTSREGSANNALDIAIADEYKIETSHPAFVEHASILINDILLNHQRHFDAQILYRRKISSEFSDYPSNIIKAMKIIQNEYAE